MSLPRITAVLLAMLPGFMIAQTNTYILNGSASQNSCNCYTLTPAVNTQSGSVWNATKINLNNPFDYVFNVYLGCADSTGADGIVFMLQPISTSVGTTGEGMGFEGISPSIGISLDTWQNPNRNDPYYDHINIQANGIVTHGTDLAGPIQASATSLNIEDCQWHTLRIVWDPVIKRLSTYFDGNLRLQSNVDLVATIFNNDPMVFWGFSAGTGGANNLQQFCTALNPEFTTSATGNSACIGSSISFTNTSQSFAPIASFYWDFGDGNTSTAANPPPHTYNTPGVYTVKLAITGLDGCFSDTIRKTITVGDYPVANFNIFDTCTGSIPRIIEQSSVTVGNITQWNWVLDGTPVSTSQIPQLDASVGPHQLQLQVQSNHGCTSTVRSQVFIMEKVPFIDAEGDDGCINNPVLFSAVQMDNATLITGWVWNMGNGQTITQQDPNYTYTYNSGGNYNVQVYAIGDNGCHSNTILIPVFINRAIANAGNDTTVIPDEPFQLQGSGGVQYNWIPGTGLSNPSIANPVGLLQDDMTYTLEVITAEGCVDTDEVNVTVFKGSAIHVPSAFTPNQDGLNDRLKPQYIGIKTLDYFTVYNRWGQVVFSTKDQGKGWDGTLKGMPQSTGTFVWTLRAIDYVGKVYQLKGTSTIIR